MPLQALAHIFVQYGFLGLFLSSFVSSLFFFPAFTYIIISIFIALKFNPYLVLVAVTSGAILAQFVNYYFGFFGSKKLIKRENEIKKVRVWLDRWGDLSIFIINLVPILPADFVSVFVGFLRMDFKTFLISMSLGKFFQFTLVIFGFELLAKFLF